MLCRVLSAGKCVLCFVGVLIMVTKKEGSVGYRKGVLSDTVGVKSCVNGVVLDHWC